MTIAVRLLREELQLLQEPGSYVGEVVKVRQQSPHTAPSMARTSALMYFAEVTLATGSEWR